MWVEFVGSLGPLPFSVRFFTGAGTPVYLSPQKPVFSNFNPARNQVDEEPLSGCTTSK